MREISVLKQIINLFVSLKDAKRIINITTIQERLKRRLTVTRKFAQGHNKKFLNP